MKISYVLALALASNLMLNAEEAVNLSPVTVSSKMQIPFRQKCKNQPSTSRLTLK